MECAPKVRFATDSRWRKQNSNHRSPSRGCRLILGEEKGPAVDQIVSKDAVLFTGDQWFESVFLQRRVYCEPDRSRSKSPPCGFQVVHPIVEIRAREADAVIFWPILLGATREESTLSAGSSHGFWTKVRVSSTLAGSCTNSITRSPNGVWPGGGAERTLWGP